MSYFMTSCGPPVPLAKVEKVSLRPLAETQDYLRRWQAAIEAADGGPASLVDDGDSGTSTDFIVAFEDAVFYGNSDAEDEPLILILRTLLRQGHKVRIWWVDDVPDGPMDLPTLEVDPETQLATFLAVHLRRNLNIRIVAIKGSSSGGSGRWDSAA